MNTVSADVGTGQSPVTPTSSRYRAGWVAEPGASIRVSALRLSPESTGGETPLGRNHATRAESAIGLLCGASAAVTVVPG